MVECLEPGRCGEGERYGRCREGERYGRCGVSRIMGVREYCGVVGGNVMGE